MKGLRVPDWRARPCWKGLGCGSLNGRATHIELPGNLSFRTYWKSALQQPEKAVHSEASQPRYSAQTGAGEELLAVRARVVGIPCVAGA